MSKKEDQEYPFRKETKTSQTEKDPPETDAKVRESSGGDIKLVSSNAINQQHARRYGLKSLPTHVYITMY